MPVYVDAAVWPYGRMMMCHMFSDELEALHLMADKVGVARRWFQNKPGFPHYDICKSKRELAVSFGAVEVDRHEFVRLVKSFRTKPTPMLYLYIHPESDCAFLTPTRIDPNGSAESALCELICEVPENFAPKNQQEFERMAKECGVVNAAEFKFSAVPVFPEGKAYFTKGISANVVVNDDDGAAGILAQSIEAGAALPPSEPKAPKGKKAQLTTVEAPADLPAQTITRLTVSNVKRISAVEITPEGSVVTVGGMNGAGKSSVLDAIQMAFGGKDTFPEKPIREGEKSAKIVCETEDLVVTRAVTPSGSTLTVSPKADAKSKFSSPQQLLDRLTGKLTFDPLAFMSLDAKAQLNTLKQLVGLDFSKEDAERNKLYDDRTLLGRELQQAKATLAATKHHTDAPADEISAASLTESILEVQKWNQKRGELSSKIDSYTQSIRTKDSELLGIYNQIDNLKAQIEKLENNAKIIKSEIASTSSVKTALEAGLAAMPVKSDEAFKAQLRDTDAVNQKVRENRAHHEAEENVQRLNTDYDQFTVEIEAIDKAKAQKLAETSFPVPGLSFNETGVLVNGQPFSQASTAEQIRVSVAMGLALNPTLRVILIRNGSLLDPKSLSLVSQMAKNAGAQFWIEMVSATGDGCSVVIEDGQLK